MLAELARQTRSLRLEANFTQAGLARHAGVSYASLRLFERTGQISLASFVKLTQTLGREAPLLAVLSSPTTNYQSIEEVIAPVTKPRRKRGRIS